MGAVTYLGSRLAAGLADPNNPRGAGFWTVEFRPQDLPVDDFEVYHIALQGPGGNVWVYLDTTFYSAAARGDINEYDPNSPMYVRKGQSIFFYWSTAEGNAPTITLFCRTPDVL